MSVIDECTQIIRHAVLMRRREKIDSIIAPAEFSGEIRDWHHLDRCDPDALEFCQLLGSSGPGSFFRERADVHFINDLTLEFASEPVRIGPAKLGWIDNARGSVRSIWLKSRRRIGMKMFGLVHPESVKRAWPSLSNSGMVSIIFALQRLKYSLRIFCRAFFQNDINPLRFWRPNPKMRLGRANDFCADRVSAFDCDHAFPSLIGCFAAVSFF